MKTLPAPPLRPGGSHPVLEESRHLGTALFAMGTWTLFYTTLPPLPPPHCPPTSWP